MVAANFPTQARGHPAVEQIGERRRPIRAEARGKLLSAIAKGRRWLDEMISGKVEGIEAIAAREGVANDQPAGRDFPSLTLLRTSSRRQLMELCRAASALRV